MSDAKLPAEGVEVIFGVRGHKQPVIGYWSGGMFYNTSAALRFPPEALDWWSTLAHAKAAGRLAEALRRCERRLVSTQGECDGCSKVAGMDLCTVCNAREVLREIGT